MPTPKQKPGLSRQDYGTPNQFLSALKIKLGVEQFGIDLAADKDNTIANHFFSIENNGLAQKWCIGNTTCLHILQKGVARNNRVLRDSQGEAERTNLLVQGVLPRVFQEPSTTPTKRGTRKSFSRKEPTPEVSTGTRMETEEVSYRKPYSKVYATECSIRLEPNTVENDSQSLEQSMCLLQESTPISSGSLHSNQSSELSRNCNLEYGSRLQSLQLEEGKQTSSNLDGRSQDTCIHCSEIVSNNDWFFLNPPFANIRPWVQKAYDEAAQGAKIAVLVPASVGANWWSDWVNDAAHVLFIKGRLTFVGEKTPYPKDCALLLYNRTYIGGNRVWDWKQELGD